MWEQIRANRRRSLVLIVLIASLLVGLGYVIGAAYGGPDGGVAGVAAAVAVWLILTLVALGGGDSIMLATAGARRVEKRDLPQLVNIVEEMTIASGLPRPPEIYLIESNSPNAFAVGSRKRSAVAVTMGLLSRLNRDELQGVIAHEIGHIGNHDTRFMVLAGVMVGAIAIVADVFLRGLRHGALSGRGRRRGGGQAQAIFFVVAIVLAILAPLFARLLYFACSRKREYLADASSARFTRFPEGLAAALEKISGLVRAIGGQSANRVLAPMYIVNPLAGRGLAGLFSTHPPTEKRVQVLRSMADGASYEQYEAAYRKVTQRAGLLGASALAEKADVPIRAAAAAEAAPPPVGFRREAMDAIHRSNDYRIAQCQCGTRLKIPPVYKKHTIACPSCGRTIMIPA